MAGRRAASCVLQDDTKRVTGAFGVGGGQLASKPIARALRTSSPADADSETQATRLCANHGSCFALLSSLSLGLLRRRRPSRFACVRDDDDRISSDIISSRSLSHSVTSRAHLSFLAAFARLVDRQQWRLVARWRARSLARVELVSNRPRRHKACAAACVSGECGLLAIGLVGRRPIQWLVAGERLHGRRASS